MYVVAPHGPVDLVRRAVVVGLGCGHDGSNFFVDHEYVKGGEKMYRTGGPISYFGLSKFRENVRLVVQQKCPSATR